MIVLHGHTLQLNLFDKGLAHVFTRICRRISAGCQISALSDFRVWIVSEAEAGRNSEKIVRQGEGPIEEPLIERIAAHHQRFMVAARAPP